MITEAQTPLYTPPDVEAAYEAHGSNCGPAALAALLGRPILELWPSVSFRGFMSFADMVKSLRALRVVHSVFRKDFKPVGTPRGAAPLPFEWFGRLVIIQWHGSWMAPGCHPGAALSRTHWIAVRHAPEAAYDVNGGDGAGGWCKPADWGVLAKRIMAEVRGCTGEWSVRSTILVRGPL